MAECIDLDAKFGKLYRVVHEESYAAQYGKQARVDDPWCKIMLCENGHLFPWGGNRLAASTNHAGPVAKALRKLPGVEVVQDGDEGVNFAFELALFDRVAEIMKPRNKRRMSQENRIAAGQRLFQFQWKKGNAAKSRRSQAVEPPQNDRPSDPTT